MASDPGRPTAERILDAAEAIFAKRGYDGASLGEVADRVGIRGPSLYNHFPNKRELYAAVLARLLDPFFELLEDLVARPPSQARAEAALKSMLHHHVENPNTARLIQHATLAGGDQLELLVERWYQPFFERVPKLIPEAGAPLASNGISGGLPGDLAAMMIAFNNMILGYVTLAPLHDRLFGRKLLSNEFARDYIGFLKRAAG